MTAYKVMHATEVMAALEMIKILGEAHYMSGYFFKWTQLRNSFIVFTAQSDVWAFSFKFLNINNDNHL